MRQKCYYKEKCLDKSEDRYCNSRENCNQKGINHEKITRQLKILQSLGER